ncbi:MAG: ribose-5-phosphate isomerase RpiA [Gammaproteobacteria bacterium]|nr:MAG: ribose-5-phosphate isomerase RpiA [Gammaproteobacteria bacterium]
MNQDQLKKMAAEAALEYVVADEYLGVGTGSTVNFFIDALAEAGIKIKGAVSSSVASTERMREKGVKVIDLEEVTETIPVYIDGADEINANLEMIKGGGGALTREKIVASACGKFICIADSSKKVEVMGKFPLPIEVIPMSINIVAKTLTKFGGKPQQRADFITDNGNLILDVSGLSITDAPELEREINNIPGIVTCGLFAVSPADVLITGSENGAQIETK